MNTAGFMIDKTHALGLRKRSVSLCLFGTRQSGTLRLHTPTRRHADTPGFVAPKWAKDFSLGRSPRNIKKSDQALKALQNKFPVHSSRFAVGCSPIHGYADTPISLLLCFVSIIFACSPCAAQSASSTDPASQPAPTAQPAQPAQPAQGVNAVQPTQTTQPAGSPEPSSSPSASPSAFTRSQNVTINLINRLVQRGVLTKEDAAELIKMAEEDAAAARAEAAQAAQASQAAQAVPLPTASPESATAQELATSPQLLPDLSALPTLKQTTPPPSPAAVPEPTPALVAGPDDTVRVTYIPEVVKKQCVDEIEQEFSPP